MEEWREGNTKKTPPFTEATDARSAQLLNCSTELFSVGQIVAPTAYPNGTSKAHCIPFDVL